MKSNLALTDRSNPWLNGFRDPISQLNVLQQCLVLTQLTGDGESRLVIADQENRIIAYKGINIDWKLNLQDTPIALAYFYPEQTTSLPQPIIALAANNHVYMYQNMQRIFRFTLPNIEMDQKEKEIWNMFDGKKETLAKMIEKWTQLKENQILTYLILEVLNEQKPQKQYTIISNVQSSGQYSIPDTPVCLGTIYNQQISEYSTQNLIIGTENKFIYIMETNGMKLQTQIQLNEVPVSILTVGVYQGDHRIIITTRNNQIIFIKNGQIEKNHIQLPSKAVQTVLLGNDIYVATMNEILQSYNQKGIKLFSIKMNSDIVCIETLIFGQAKQTQGILVGLDNSELRLYKEKQLVHTLKLDGMISAMKFGPFGREEGMLVMILKHKGLDIRILQRNFNAQNFISQQQNKVQDDDIPLNIPKKTKLFIENSQRQRENYVQIHKSFQKDIMKMRLKTAQQYINFLEESSNNNLMKNGEINVRIQANVRGLGPLFKIELVLENMGDNCVYNICINYIYDNMVYRVIKGINQIPFLMPYVSLPIVVEILNIDKNGASDTFKIVLAEKKKSNIICGCVIQIPMSELRE